MKYFSRIYFVLVISLFLIACSDDDNPSKNEDTGPTAIEGTVSWEIQTTDINHQIAVPIEANPMFNGEGLANGDKIGVFYNVNGTYKCGGYTVWNGQSIAIAAWGDDATTSDKDGFSSGEQFTWRIQRVSDQNSYSATVEYKEGPTTYSSNGITVLESLKVE